MISTPTLSKLNWREPLRRSGRAGGAVESE
jgi:hypothetical protein